MIAPGIRKIKNIYTKKQRIISGNLKDINFSKMKRRKLFEFNNFLNNFCFE